MFCDRADHLLPDYVFVDEHNRHKRLKGNTTRCALSPAAANSAPVCAYANRVLLVMRACEGCRRRKIKCDAATTNSWPCSACVRLKLHCVRPNGFDSAGDPTTYEAFITPDQFQQMSMQMPPHDHPKGPGMYPHMANYTENPGGFYSIPYDASQAQHDINYTTVPAPALMDPSSYQQQNGFPTPPTNQSSLPAASPGAHSTESYQQQDLADLLGTLKLNELGTGENH